MRYLGIDLGSKTVGLAISDTTLTIASSLKTIFFKDEDYLSTIDAYTLVFPSSSLVLSVYTI